MDSDTFADGGAVADEDITLFALEFQILGFLPHGSPLEDLAILAYLGPAGDDHMRADLRALANLHMLPDHRIRTYLHILGNPRPR